MPAIQLSDKLREEYQRLFDTITIDSNKKEEVKEIVKEIFKNRNTYKTIGGEHNIRWYLVGIIHYKTKENENFPEKNKLIWDINQDEDKLSDKLQGWSDTSLPAILYRLEKDSDKNWAYRNMHPEVRSPYLWGASTHYDKGYFNSENKWFEEKSPQIGVAILLREILKNTFPEESPDMLRPLICMSQPDSNGVYGIIMVKETTEDSKLTKLICKDNEEKKICTEIEAILCSGNYVMNLPIIPLQAVFSLWFDTAGYETDGTDVKHVVALDSYDSDSKQTLSQRRLTQADFFLPVLDPVQKRLFRLDFTPPSPDAILEFRIYYNGSNRCLIADKIFVIDPAKVQLVFPEPSRPSGCIDIIDVSKILFAPSTDEGDLCRMKGNISYKPTEKPLKAIFSIFKSKYFNEKIPILVLEVFNVSKQESIDHKWIWHNDFSMKNGGYEYFDLEFTSPLTEKTELEFRIKYFNEENGTPSNLKPYYILVSKIWVIDSDSAVQSYSTKSNSLKQFFPEIVSPTPMPRYWPWP